MLARSRVPMDAARTIRLSMEESAKKSVSPQAFASTVLARYTHAVGKRCETRLRKSCQEYKAAGINMSGLHKIIDDSNQILQVFCDFDSEPGFAWSLIQSFSLSNQHYFEVIVVGP